MASPEHRMKSLSDACVMQIQEGADADILLLDQSSLELKYVIAKGAIVRTPHWVRGGLFERGPRIRPIQPI